MTRKDYILIAETIYNHFNQNIEYYYKSENNLKLGDLIRELADKLNEDNPRFDKTRFLIKCGYSQ